MSESKLLDEAETKALLLELARLKRENESLRQRVAELTDLSDRDPLLGVLNRRAFLRELERVQAYSVRHALKASIVFFDLNGLGRINNRHGHEAGDEALRCICRTVRACVRSSDLFGRLGGDEFGLVFVGTDIPATERKMEMIEETLAETRIDAGLTPGGITVSITYGVHAIGGNCSAESLIAQADQAFYVRKGRHGTMQP